MSVGVVPGDPRWGLGRSSRSSGYRSRTYYLPDELHFRMRNAWWHTQTQPGGHDSISELVAFALLPLIEELELRYHDGQPFPDIPERRRPQAGPSGRVRQAHALRLQAAMRREGLLADEEDESGPGEEDESGPDGDHEADRQDHDGHGRLGGPDAEADGASASGAHGVNGVTA